MLLKAIVGLAVLILGVAIFAGRPHFKRYRVPSESMEPTIHRGETVSLNGSDGAQARRHRRSSTRRRAPQEFDRMCGEAPAAGQPCAKARGGRGAQTFIKRIVAGPGDGIALERGPRDPQRQAATGAVHHPCDDTAECDFPRPITVPDGTYYLLGDNRGASDDSRFWGPVPEDWILGRVERCSAIYFFCSPV